MNEQPSLLEPAANGNLYPTMHINKMRQIYSALIETLHLACNQYIKPGEPSSIFVDACINAMLVYHILSTGIMPPREKLHEAMDLLYNKTKENIDKHLEVRNKMVGRE